MNKDYWPRRRIKQITDKRNGSLKTTSREINDFFKYLENYDSNQQGTDAQSDLDRRSIMTVLEFLPFVGYLMLGNQDKEAIRGGVERRLYPREVVLGAQEFYERAFEFVLDDGDSDHTHKSFFNEPVREETMFSQL